MSFFSFPAPGQAQTVFLSLLLFGLATACSGTETIASFDKFRKFEQIYEPSGVQQLPDGRFVVIEDEAVHPMGLFSLLPDGQVSELPLYRSSLTGWISPNRVLSSLEDLEAVAMDELGRIYAITSHSRKASGRRADEREQLVRFSLEGEQVTGYQAVHKLRKAISRQHDALKDSTKIRDVKDDGGFNIEGLSFDAGKQKLLIGLRSPRAGSNAIIVVLENPRAVFDHGEKPRVSDQLIELDLDGGGIRAICYDPHLGGYLIISRKPGKSFKLWLWSGNDTDSPQRLRIPHIKNLRQAEGVTPVLIDGRAEGILIVSDDGIGVKRKPGHYIFLRYEQLARK